MAERERPADAWASGDAYESYVGRWSRLVAREFITALPVPPGSRWLDVGCGTGALTQAILDLASPSTVRGIDASEGFVGHASQRVRDQRATFAVADAQDLPAADATYDAAVSGLVLNFIPDPLRAAREMARVTRAGGVVAAYVWDYASGMQLMRYFWDAAVAVDPAAADLDEGRRFPLCQPAALRRLFEDAGLAQVATQAIVVPTHFRDFDDYWLPFLGGQGPAPGYTGSLRDEVRAALRERLRGALPVGADGSIRLTARAWAVRGTR